MSSVPRLESSQPDEPHVRPRSPASVLLGGFKYVAWKIARLPGIFWCMFLIVAIAIYLMSIGIRSARESARRNTSLCKMKGLMIGLQNHHDVRGRLPASGDKSKSQLSWRVRILPYLEEQELYEEFHLDEPWDSEHNRALIPRMPDAYCSPALYDLAEGETVFLAVTGLGTAFEDGKKGLKFKELKDGTSKTVLVVEADRDEAVIWTKPDDWEFDPTAPTRGLGHLYQSKQTFFAGFADAHTEGVDINTRPESIKAMMTRDGGEREPLPY